MLSKRAHCSSTIIRVQKSSVFDRTGNHGIRTLFCCLLITTVVDRANLAFAAACIFALYSPVARERLSVSRSPPRLSLPVSPRSLRAPGLSHGMVVLHRQRDRCA